MDIATSSRPYFSHPSPTPSEKISLQASATVYTYHCLCSHLLLATTTPLPSLPVRKHAQDAAHIMPLPPPPPPSAGRKPSASTPLPDSQKHYGLLLSMRAEKTAQVVTSDEGFEKRYLQRCGRCALVVGYQLDWGQFAVDRTGRREDFVFLLPGGLVTTREMIAGKQGNADAATTAAAGGGIGAAVGMTEVKA